MLRSLAMKAQAAASGWRQDALLRAIRPAQVAWRGGHQQQQHAHIHSSSQLPMRLPHGRARSHSSLAPAAVAAAGGAGGSSSRGGSPAAAVAVLEESGERIEEKELHVEASESYLAYAMSVIVGRALPDVRDGLKPVHRRILFAMHDLGISAARPYKKCARVVGEVLGKYHPHGDSAVYDALVRLAQDFSMQLPLVSGHGNFGSLDDDPPAAMRYTECRLAGAAEDLLLEDLEADTVDWAPTFDASQDEPLVLPAKVPHLLVNGAQGIAVGIATKIPPHNLAEVVAALRALVAQPDISSAALMRHIPAPDFPTGGELLVGPETEAAYATGNGSVLLRATAAIEYEGAGSSGKKRASSAAKAKAAASAGDAGEAAASGKALVVFSEMPYQVCKADLVSRIAELVESKVLDGIADVRDESDRTGVRLVVEVRRGFSPQLVLNQLYKHTRLQLRFAANMVALVGGVPKTLTLRDFLQHFLDFRVSVVERRAQHRLAKAAARLHLVEGLLAALEQLDAVVQAIRAAQDGPAAKAVLVASFGLTEAQAEGVLGMTLRRLTGLEAGKLREEQATLTATIADLQALLADRQRVLQVVLDEAQAAADKHGQPRRSRIVSESPAAAELKEEDVVPNTPSLITVSSRGFIKRMPSSSWEAQRRGGTGKSGAKLRENEALQELLSLTAHDTLLFLSAGGRAHAVKAHKVPEASRTAAGTSISQVLGLPAPERFPALLAVRSFSDPGLSLAMATTTGRIKRTPLQAFSKMTRAGLGAIKLLEGEQLAGGALAAEGSQVILASSGGKLARFSMSTVRQASRTAGCIKGMKLPPGQQLVSMAVLPPALAQGAAAAGQQQPQDDAGAGAGTDESSSGQGPWLVLVTSKGFGKRVPLADIPLKVARGAQGVIGVKLSAGDSLALAQLVFSEDDDVVLASKQGMMTRVGAAGIKVLSRATKGVILCRFKDGDEVQSLAVVPAEHKDALA